MDIRQVGRELGVRYVLEGSVRRNNSQVRVTGQLIAAEDGSHLWADKFDGKLEDVFSLQDEITYKVAKAIGQSITHSELNRVQSRKDRIFSAWEHYILAEALIKESAADKIQEARQQLKFALEIDPNFSTAYARIATCCIQDIYNEWGNKERSALIAEGLENAKKACQCDPNDPLGHEVLASVYQVSGELQQAIRCAREALGLSTTCMSAHGILATSLALLGEPKAAFDAFEASMRVSPRDPDRSGSLMGAVMAYFFTNQYEEALNAAEEHTILKPRWYGSQLYIAASAAYLGNQEKAATAVEKLLHLLPGLTANKLRERLLLRRDSDVDHLIQGLTKAGLMAT